MFSVSFLSRFLKDREIVFCILNRLQASRLGDLILAGAPYISPKLETDSGAHTASYSICTVPSCLGVKQPGHIDQSIPLLPRPRLSGAKPLLHIYLLSLRRYDFILSRFLICVNGERTRGRVGCLRQPTLPLDIRINTGSLYRNVSILNYKRDKDNVS